MLKLCLVKRLLSDSSMPPRSGSRANAGSADWLTSKDSDNQTTWCHFQPMTDAFRGIRLLKATRRQAKSHTDTQQLGSKNSYIMYDLYTASMNFTPTPSQFPGYYNPQANQSCMQQQAAYQDYCGYEQYNNYQALLSAFSGDEDIITRRCLEVIIVTAGVKLGNVMELSSQC